VPIRRRVAVVRFFCDFCSAVGRSPSFLALSEEVFRRRVDVYEFVGFLVILS